MKNLTKKILITLLLLAMLLPVISYASDTAEFARTNKVGAVLGGILDQYCEDALPGGEPEYYYIAADMPLALETGKIDAYIDDELSAIAHCKTYNNIRIDKVLASDNYGFIFNKNNEKLRDEMNEYILRMREEGELDRLKKIWVDGDDEELKVVDFENLPATHGTLNISIGATMPPMVYVKDGTYAGYEVALITGFCREHGYAPEFSNTEFSSVLAAVTSGKADIGAASISITEERKESMLFSESHVAANVVSVVRISDSKVRAIGDYNHARIGVLEGSVNIATAQKYFPDAVLQYYSSHEELAAALDKNVVDAYITDEPSARMLLSDYEDQSILTTLESSSYAFAFPKEDPDSEKLREQLDNYLYKIKENGTLRDIDNVWFGQDESKKTVDLDRLKKNSKMLTIAAFVSEPLVYTKDGNYVGYEIDILAGFCEEYGYDLDINEYSFDGLLNAVQAGRCDMAVGDISITEDRKEVMLFSEPDYDSGNVLVVKNKNAAAQEGFFATIKNSFYKTFIQESRWKLFAQGILTTMLVALLSVVCGTLLAYVIFLLYYKNKTAVNKVINGYCELVEKTPAVVILMILYYIVFGRLDISATFVAALGLSMKFSVRVFGLLRIGAGAIDKGQTEAALALSYSDKKAFTKIVLPQAIMHVIAGYKSSIVNLIEETAVVGYIAVQDLTKISDIIRSRTYEAFFPLIVSALFYVLVAVLLITIVKNIEIKIDPRKRKEEDILKGIER